MLWFFLLIIFATFVAAAWPLIQRQERFTILAMHAMALLMIGIAWFAGHYSFLGWMTLVLGVALEVQARRPQTTRTSPRPAFVPPSISRAEPSVPVQRPVEKVAEPASKIQPPATAAAPNIQVPSYVTYALLKSPHDITGDVLIASLRRAGRRDATLSGRKPDGTWQIQFGPLFLELVRVGKLPDSTLEYAAAQTFDWPEALETCRKHAAAVRLATPLHGSASRPDLVRVHHQAHAAMTEFAPVLAIYWEGPGRLTPEATIKSLAVEQGDKLDLYVTLRSFPSDNGSSILCDSVGLHAFGLPDVQITTPAEPEEEISNLLYDTAAQFFREGCRLIGGQEISLPSGKIFHAVFTHSRQAPDRSIVELEQQLASADTVAAEKVGHDAVGDEQPAPAEPQALGGHFEQAEG